MEARDGHLTLCGYDEDVSARATVPIEGEATGTVLVSGRLLAALVATFPAGKPVEAESDDRLLTLKSGRVTVTLPLMGASDYPTLPVAPSTVAMLPGDVLTAAIGRVVPAAAKDPTAGIWCAMWMEFADERLEVLASDTRRVAQVFVPALGATAATAIVPAAVVGEAVRMMTGDAEVEIGISANLVSFAVAGRTLTVRQAAQKYAIAQIHKTLTIDPAHAAVVPVMELMPAVKRAGLMKAEGHPTLLDWSAGELAGQRRGWGCRVEGGRGARRGVRRAGRADRGQPGQPRRRGGGGHRDRRADRVRSLHADPAAAGHRSGRPGLPARRRSDPAGEVMRTYDEIESNMRRGHTFSSMGDFEHWAARGWCVRCAHEDGCPLVDAALINTGMTPAEWTPMDGPDGPFRCAEFKAAP